MARMLIEKALRWVVIIGVFCLPFVVVIVASSMFFPFITGKNFAFRIIVDVITGAWLALALISEKYRPRRSWILAAFTLCVFVMAIADAQGVAPFKSFWSNYERMDGWITLAHTLAYLVVASSVIASEKMWRFLWQVNLAVSVFLSVDGLLQVVGVTALGQGGAAGLGARVDATFGNPIYLAVYMLFNVGIAALLWVQMWQVRSAGKRLWPSVMYGAIISLDTLVLFLTGTRGTMFGLMGGALLALLLIAFFQGSKKLRTIAITSLIAVIILGAAIKFEKDSHFVKSIGFLDRLAQTTLSGGTVETRFLNMGIAWQGVKERPILGWGQENYAIVFDRYFDPRMYHAEPWYDRTHDLIFDWLVTGGFVGLFAYLSILIAALWAIWMRGVFSIPERAILTGLLAGYVVHNLTVFDNVTSYIFFATVLAYLVWREREAGKSAPLFTHKLLPENSLPFVSAIAAILTFASVWWINIPGMEANWTLLQAVAPQQGGVTKNLEDFKQAIAYGTMGTQEAREQIAQISVQVAGSQLDSSIKQQFFDLATSEMQKQEQQSPLDARFPLFLGSVLDAYGQHDAAAAAFQKAHDLSPRKQSILNLMAQNAMTRGDGAATLQDFKTAFDVLPADTDARINYAAMAIQMKQDDLADQLLAPIVSTGEAATDRIASAYLARGRYDKIATIWEAHIAAAPQDLQGYFTLAAAYYALGNKPKSIEALQKAKTAIPSSAQQVDALVLQIQNGTVKLQ